MSFQTTYKEETVVRKILDNACIIVAGYGRSGTTMMDEVLREAINQPYRLFYRDLCRAMPNAIIKTHDFGPPYEMSLGVRAKVLYLYSDPYIAAISSHKRPSHDESGNLVWDLELHYYNMHSDYSEKDLWLEKDTLRHEENFDSWCRPFKHIDVLMIKFESMWVYENAIRSFVGIDFKLPPMKRRFSNYNLLDSLEKAKLVKVYRSLKDKYDNMEPIKFYKAVGDDK